jgi:2-dehydropantoate 2-reductase
MTSNNPTYILGSGAIGFPLATFLADAGRPVVAVRTSRTGIPRSSVTVTVRNGKEISAPVETASLDQLPTLDGLIVITSKANANEALSQQLKEKGASGPVVILQNGVGVEQPFLDAGLSPVYRCVLYITSQGAGEYQFMTRPVTVCPIGTVEGDEDGLQQAVATLSTDHLQFRTEPNIEREVWKKAIINAVFNSICPLLDIDNGIFVRDETVAALARDVIRECVALTTRLNLDLTSGELMEQLLRISSGSQGQLISTLQDIRAGRPTEIEFLNLEIARVAAGLEPPVAVPRTELLGRMVAAKAMVSEDDRGSA